MRSFTTRRHLNEPTGYVASGGLGMDFNDRKERLIFSSGVTAYALAGIVSLAPDGSLKYGYDGEFEDENLSKEDKLELIDEMIGRWEKYRENVLTE
jgi:hypothetical protein